MRRLLSMMVGLVVLLGAACGPRTLPLDVPLKAGETVRIATMREDLGQRRSFLLHVPAKWDGARPLPVVVALHGAFMTAEEMEQRSGLSRLADEEGFAVIYPEGVGVLGYLQHWNAGFCCGKAAADGVDDLGFIDICISETLQRLPLNKKRIYLAGLSNGGMLALHYALNGRHTLAGVLAVAAALPEEPPAFPPDRECPLMLVHGLEDTHIPYKGGGFKNRDDGPRFLAQEDAARYWALGNGCVDAAERLADEAGGVASLSWRDCPQGNRVQLLSLPGFGHDWPAGEGIGDAVGETSGVLRDVDGGIFDAGRVFWMEFGGE